MKATADAAVVWHVAGGLWVGAAETTDEPAGTGAAMAKVGVGANAGGKFDAWPAAPAWA